MSWAKDYIERLVAGETVSFRPRGHSMSPRVKNRELVTVSPGVEPLVGSVVLCCVLGQDYLHLVKAVRKDGDAFEYLIGNNKGRTNGWVRRGRIFGVQIVPD